VGLGLVLVPTEIDTSSYLVRTLDYYYQPTSFTITCHFMSSHEVQQKLDQYLAPQTAKRAMTSAHLPRTKIHRTTVDDEDIFRDWDKATYG
jgi:hypothetical protein